MAEVVSGPVATGQPPGPPPVLIAGSDGTNTRTLLTDTSGAIVTTQAGDLPPTIYNGKTAVTTAGTRVPLAGSQAILNSVVVRALSTNTGLIYVGSSAVASTNGLQLAAGDSVAIVVANLATVNLDCSVNGEGVTYLAT